MDSAREHSDSLNERPRVRVLVADDDPLARRAIRGYVALDPHLIDVGEVADGADVLARVQELSIDVVIMDINMPKVDGIEALRILKRHSPETCVVMMTCLGERSIVHDAMAAGASGYGAKDSPPQVITDAIRLARQGMTVVPEHAAPQYRETGKTLPEDLSDRQQEVLLLLCQGAGNRDIAKELGISESTVKTYVNTLMDKFGANSRLQIVVAAHQRGYPPID